MPSRRSREGLGRGLLWSKWGEAKFWDVISCKGGSQILSEVSLGRLIYPRISGWSRRDRRSAFSLALKLGNCECCGRKKVWGCATGVLLIGWLIPRNQRISIGHWPRPGCWAGSQVGRILIGWCCGLPPSSSTWPQASCKPWMNFCRRCGNGRCRGRWGHLKKARCRRHGVSDPFQAILIDSRLGHSRISPLCTVCMSFVWVHE